MQMFNVDMYYSFWGTGIVVWKIRTKWWSSDADKYLKTPTVTFFVNRDSEYYRRNIPEGLSRFNITV